MSENRIWPGRFEFRDELRARDYVEWQSAIAEWWENVLGHAAHGQVTYSVDYDAPALPTAATSLAARALFALDRHPPLHEWFRRNIGRVVVHSGPGVDVVAITDGCIHFFQAKISGDPWEHGIRLFDRLSREQQTDYSSVAPHGTPAREDFALVFAWIFATHGEEGKILEKLSQFCADATRWSNAATVALLTPHQSVGSLELDGDQQEWSDVKNERRCELIDKQIVGSASVEERLELDQLQRQAMAYRDRVAPLPMAGALRLHAELVAEE